MAQKAVIYNPLPGVEPYVYAEDFASIINGLLAGHSGILPTGEKLSAVKINDNLIRISDGDYSNQGYVIRIPGGETLDIPIESGYQGLNRIDLIISEFFRTEQGDSHEIKVIKGVAATVPIQPQLTQGDLNDGARLRQEALYRVKITNTTITSLEAIAPVITVSGGIADIVISKTQPAYADGRIWICPED